MYSCGTSDFDLLVPYTYQILAKCPLTCFMCVRALTCACTCTYVHVQLAKTRVGWVENGWRVEDTGKSKDVQGGWASCLKVACPLGEQGAVFTGPRSKLRISSQKYSYWAQAKCQTGTSCVFGLRLRPWALQQCSFPSADHFHTWSYSLMQGYC